MTKKHLIVLGIFFGLMLGEAKAKDRGMMEMIELVVLSQKYEKCRTIEDGKRRLECFDSLTGNTKELMKIYQHVLDLKLVDPLMDRARKNTQSKHEWGK